MSDDKKPEAPATGPKPPPSVLTKPTDHAPRPGFRSPPNAGSKVQKTAAVAKSSKGKKK